MKTLTIGFSRANTSFPIFSWLIMLSERTNYSHVYLKYKDSFIDRYVYYQASHTLVNYMSSSVFLGQEHVVQEFEFQVPDELFIKTLQFATDNAGKPYGVLSILGLAIVQVGKLVGLKFHNPFKDNGQTYVCDQLVATILQSVDGFKLPMNINDMTPADLFPVIKSLPSVWTSN